MVIRTRSGRVPSLVLAVLLALPAVASAVSSGPAPTPVAPRSAEAEYNTGLQAKTASRFADAAVSFQRAVDIRPSYAEAWNELGFALRQTGRYDDALGAYDRALTLRPNFPEALEYLGETYVKLGRLADARVILERLTPLDSARADELRQAIQAGH